MPTRPVTGWERALAVAIFVGQVLEAIVLLLIGLAILFAILVGLAVMLVVGMTRLGRQAEYRTRPQ